MNAVSTQALVVTLTTVGVVGCGIAADRHMRGPLFAIFLGVGVVLAILNFF